MALTISSCRSSRPYHGPSLEKCLFLDLVLVPVVHLKLQRTFHRSSIVDACLQLDELGFQLRAVDGRLRAWPLSAMCSARCLTATCFLAAITSFTKLCNSLKRSSSVSTFCGLFSRKSRREARSRSFFTVFEPGACLSSPSLSFNREITGLLRFRFDAVSHRVQVCTQARRFH